MRSAFWLALAACGADPKPTASPGVPPLADDRSLSSLTPAETEQWCTEETTLPAAVVTDLQVQQVECTVSALSTLGDSMTDPAKNETCQLLVETCMSQAPEPRPCTLGQLRGSCRRATLRQLRACVGEMHAAMHSLAQRDLCAEPRSSDRAWWAAASYQYGPACTVIARLCDA